MKIYDENRTLFWRSNEGEERNKNEQNTQCLVACELRKEDMQLVVHLLALNRTMWLKKARKRSR